MPSSVTQHTYRHTYRHTYHTAAYIARIEIHITCIAWLQVVIATHNTFNTELSKPRWRRWRLRVHGGKQRVHARFWNKVELE